VCLVDLTGQNRELPGLNRQKQLPSISENVELEEILPWKVGFSETSGMRNKCVCSSSTLLRISSVYFYLRSLTALHCVRTQRDQQCFAVCRCSFVSSCVFCEDKNSRCINQSL